MAIKRYYIVNGYAQENPNGSLMEVEAILAALEPVSIPEIERAWREASNAPPTHAGCPVTWHQGYVTAMRDIRRRIVKEEGERG